MVVRSITIKKFKAIDEIRFDLKAINVLTGGNNAGKSCALQAIHVAVALAQSAKAEGAANFAPEKLRYAPTELFTDLKFREQMSERGDPVMVSFEVEKGGELETFDVPLRRGRNSTISTVSPTSLQEGLGAELASSERPFSVYVPGLAGIPSRETYQGRLVVDRGAVRGDANLYLRNVLYRLFRDPVKQKRGQVHFSLSLGRLKKGSGTFFREIGSSAWANFELALGKRFDLQPEPFAAPGFLLVGCHAQCIRVVVNLKRGQVHLVPALGRRASECRRSTDEMTSGSPSRTH